MAVNRVTNSNSKHIEVRHHFLREHIEKGEFGISHVESKHQHADFVTNPLPRGPSAFTGTSSCIWVHFWQRLVLSKGFLRLEDSGTSFMHDEIPGTLVFVRTTWIILRSVSILKSVYIIRFLTLRAWISVFDIWSQVGEFWDWGLKIAFLNLIFESDFWILRLICYFCSKIWFFTLRCETEFWALRVRPDLFFFNLTLKTWFFYFSRLRPDIWFLNFKFEYDFSIFIMVLHSRSTQFHSAEDRLINGQMSLVTAAVWWLLERCWIRFRTCKILDIRMALGLNVIFCFFVLRFRAW